MSVPLAMASTQHETVTERVEEDNSKDLEEMEDEFEMEQELDRLTAKLDKYRGQDKFMKIGKNKFEINDKDPIFYLNGPNRKEVRTGACVSCVDHVFENGSVMKFCQFCG